MNDNVIGRLCWESEPWIQWIMHQNATYCKQYKLNNFTDNTNSFKFQLQIESILAAT